MQNSQNGRSMIEMLGVLAIIGLLSIGGLWGLGVAIARHKANQIQNYVTTCVMDSYTRTMDTLYTGLCQNVLEEKIPVPMGLSEYVDSLIDVEIGIPTPGSSSGCYKDEGVYHGHCAFIQADMNVTDRRVLNALLRKNEDADKVDDLGDLSRREGQVGIYGYESQCQNSGCPVIFHFIGAAKDVSKVVPK